jgi:hypothetical protein
MTARVKMSLLRLYMCIMYARVYSAPLNAKSEQILIGILLMKVLNNNDMFTLRPNHKSQINI